VADPGTVHLMAPVAAQNQVDRHGVILRKPGLVRSVTNLSTFAPPKGFARSPIHAR
jgi:hypothetical protein